MKRFILLFIISSVTTLFCCSGSPIEARWRYIGVSDQRKMSRDYSSIISNISSSTVAYMRSAGMIDTSDSLTVFSCAEAPEIVFSIKPFIFSRGKREFTGSLGCKNRFKSRFLSGSGKIFLKEIAMTTLPCGQCDLNFLFMYRQYLFAINGYRVNHDTLVLKTLFSNDLQFLKISN